MCFFVKLLNNLPSCVFSPQSSEQKQAPGPPRTSLPVQPQTRTTVSTPFFYFHPSIQSSHSPCHFPSPLTCYVIHPHARPRCCVRTFIGVEGSNPSPWWHSAALCCRGEVKNSACQHRCTRILRGERAPGVNVLLGPARNFYSEIQVSQSGGAGHTDGEKTPTCSFHSLHSLLVLFCSISSFLAVFSSENPCQLRLKVETPTFYSHFYWVAFKTHVFIWAHATATPCILVHVYLKWSEGIWATLWQEFLFLYFKLFLQPRFCHFVIWRKEVKTGLKCWYKVVFTERFLKCKTCIRLIKFCLIMH